jgi:hypothetical protein
MYNRDPVHESEDKPTVMFAPNYLETTLINKNIDKNTSPKNNSA